MHEPPSPCSTRSPSSTLSFWPHFFLQTSRFFRTFLDLSGFGSLRLACGTAIKSVRISMSVFGFAPTRDEPAECLPWTRRTGVRPVISSARRCSAHSGRRWPRPYVELILSHLWNSKLAICLYVTAAVRGGSPRASRTWSQRPKLVQGSLEPVASLVPPPPPSLPLSFFAFWGFPEWNTQDLPSLSLVCPWTIIRSWEHLPFSPLPLSPSLFLSFSLPSLFPLPWVSLDAFVIAGNPFPFFFSFGVSLDACVVAGNTFLPFPFFSFFFSSLPTPPSCQDLSVGCY